MESSQHKLQSLFDLHFIARAAASREMSAMPFDLDGSDPDLFIRMTSEQAELLAPLLSDPDPPYDPNAAMVGGGDGSSLYMQRDIILPLQKQHHHLLRMLVSCAWPELRLRAASLWATSLMQQYDTALSRMQIVLEQMLLRHDDSTLLLYSFRDSLEDTTFVDMEQSTARLDLEKGMATGGGTRTVLEPSQIQSSTLSAGVLTAVEIATPSTIVDKKRPPLLLSRRIFVSDTLQGVSLRMTLLAASISDFGTINGLVIRMAKGGGVEKVRVHAAWEDARRSETFEQAVTGRDVTFSWLSQSIPLTSCVVEFISDRIDGRDAAGAYHDILVESITILQGGADTDTSLYTHPIRFVDGEGVEQPFRSLVCLYEGAGVQPWLSVEFDEASGFEEFFPIRSGVVVGVAGGQVSKNFFVRDSQLLIPWIEGESQRVGIVNFDLSGLYFPPLASITADTTGARVFDVSDMVVIRNIGSTSPYTDLTNPELSDLTEAGWERHEDEDNRRSTYVFIPPGLTHTMDVGNNTITINGKSRSGVQQLQEGIHHIEIAASLWSDLSGINPNKVALRDPLYPHNPRYLIQGYGGVGVYRGVPMFGARVLTYVDPDHMISGVEDPTSSTWLSRYTLDVEEAGGTIKTRIVIPIKPTGAAFYRERIGIWVRSYDKTKYAKRFKLRFDFRANGEQQSVLTSYDVRGF